MRFKTKITQKWSVLLLLALLTMLALGGCEPGVDEEEVPVTVTTTGLDVGVETTVVVEATPEEPEEVGVDTTVPAQDPLLPVTEVPTVTAEGEAVAEETPTTPVATEPAFEEAMQDESSVILRLSTLLGHPVATALDENVGEVMGALVDTQGTLSYILLGGGEYLADNETIVAVEANLFDATFEEGDEDGTIFYLGSIPYLQSLSPLDRALPQGDSLAVNTEDAGVAAETENLLWIGEPGMLSNLNLLSPQGEDPGEVQDLIINLSPGQVLYVVINTGERTIAIPWQRLQYDATADHFAVNADETTLANAPILNLEEWQQPVAPDWDAEIQQFWQETE